MNRNQTLDSAKAAVNRAPKSYGNPREHFERVARHWNAHLFGRGFHCVDRLSPTDVAIMLGLVKIARLEHDPQHADSWCDLAGYAACGAEVSEPEIKPQFAAGEFVPFYAKPGETLSQSAVRAVKEADLLRWCGAQYTPQTVRIVPAPPQEPAWKRAKVGDRIRIREGAKNFGGGLRFKGVETVTAVENSTKDRRLTVGANWVLNDDVLEILPPLPESQFGFTVGETVNLRKCKVGSDPGTVVGFCGGDVLVRWNHWKPTDQPLEWTPSALRHGA